ncbi:hypothetical protein B0T20DRAFT_468891 [Sordaria brevicollis]|uniref:Uncharacterized protein n=1 Tax=Sordaria brevicollis TaxID=83679 RepID=A0AAE0PFW4_SORBR|nr:hypothetical protein B0T20DRAFT_468891 [Sordaria brevicollis]
MMEPEYDPDVKIPSIYFTRSVFNPDTLKDEPVIGKWRHQLFHGVWLVLNLHVAEQRHPLESFSLDHYTADRMGQLLDKQIQSIVRYNCWPWRAYGVAKLRKIFVLAVLSTEDYIDFFGDLLRTFAANHNGREMSDQDLPLQGNQVRGLPEKYTEAFHTFIYREEEILAEMREVRDAALTLSFLSHADCQRTEKN